MEKSIKAKALHIIKSITGCSEDKAEEALLELYKNEIILTFKESDNESAGD